MKNEANVQAAMGLPRQGLACGAPSASEAFHASAPSPAAPSSCLEAARAPPRARAGRISARNIGWESEERLEVKKPQLRAVLHYNVPSATVLKAASRDRGTREVGIGTLKGM